MPLTFQCCTWQTHTHTKHAHTGVSVVCVCVCVCVRVCVTCVTLEKLTEMTGLAVCVCGVLTWYMRYYSRTLFDMYTSIKGIYNMDVLVSCIAIAYLSHTHTHTHTHTKAAKIACPRQSFTHSSQPSQHSRAQSRDKRWRQD